MLQARTHTRIFAEPRQAVDTSRRRCPICRERFVPFPNQEHCSARCRLRAFRLRQRAIGRRRTRTGYRDGLSAKEAHERYGDPA